MLQLIRKWRRRASQVQHEQLALQALPAATLDTAHLRPFSKAYLAECFSPLAVTSSEWSVVSKQIDRIFLIEELKTAGVNSGDRRAIYYLIRALRPRSVLEVGTNVGASTLHIAAAMARNQEAVTGKCKFVTIDIIDVNNATNAYWKQIGLPRSPLENIAYLDMARCVEFVTADSLAYFDSHTELFDFIFLDGDHAATTVYQEISRALNHLRANGTILLHDFFPGQRPLWRDGAVTPGPSLAVGRYQKEGVKIRALPVGKLPWPTKLGSNVTSLALLMQ